jgi:hypothetical protein
MKLLTFSKWKVFESFSKNINDQILTDDFLNHFLDDILILEYFEDLYKNEKDSDQDFKTWLIDELTFRIDIIKNEVLDNIHDDTVKLWRKMMIDEDWLNDKDGPIKLGRYWSWNRESSGSYASEMNTGNEVLLEAIVSTKYIDWIGTIRAGLDPFHWGEENEIRLLDGSPVNLISATIKRNKKLSIDGIQFIV